MDRARISNVITVLNMLLIDQKTEDYFTKVSFFPPQLKICLFLSRNNRRNQGKYLGQNEDDKVQVMLSHAEDEKMD